MQTCKGTKQRKLSGVVTGAILGGSLFAFAAIPAHAASSTIHEGTGYGVEVKVGGVAKLGPIAHADFPSCFTQNVGSFTATVASVNQADLVSTGIIDSVASSTATTATTSSDVLGVDLLDGLITSSEIKAVSTSFLASDGTFQSNTTGSTFGSLMIGALRVSANVAPNTVINLPLVGSVTLNEQIPYVSSDEAKLTVNMIHVRITLGSQKGTEIIISSATSELKIRTTPAVVAGYAYAPMLTAGPVTVGPLVYELIPCFGTGTATNADATETDSVASTSIPGIATTGVVTVTGSGYSKKASAGGQATTSIAGVNLLSGLVTATAMNGVANASTTDGVNYELSGGSTFVGLAVAGYPAITVNPAPNTKIVLANLGTLYINRVEYFADKIRVVPVELVINTTNSLGLPIGADLTLGAAEVSLHSEAIP
jgi:hypothetical protein